MLYMQCHRSINTRYVYMYNKSTVTYNGYNAYDMQNLKYSVFNTLLHSLVSLLYQCIFQRAHMYSVNGNKQASQGVYLGFVEYYVP